MRIELPTGAAMGVGSLPHRDAAAAVELVLTATPALPAIPSLPQRSPLEGMLAQGAVGMPGVHVDEDGQLHLNPLGRDRLDPDRPVETDLDSEAFGGFRAFLAAARGREGPVKWQVTGPVTLGLALVRAGAEASRAFAAATTAVRSRLSALAAAVADAMPRAPQLVVVDEPGLSGLSEPGFPLAADPAADLVSGALAVLEPHHVVGVHCCGPTDIGAVLAAGPAVLSVPAVPSLLASAGTLSAFLDSGGWVAWGAVPTGPLGTGGDRWWRALADLWCELVRAGCDPVRLRRQALVSPACGLALHTDEQAVQVLDLTRQIAVKVRQQAAAARFSVGA